VDSRTVNRAIRGTIRPLLKEAGFSRFTTRNAWRYTASRVEVLNFQSFNSYLAESLGCTTYSFSVNLGSFLLDIPPGCGFVRVKKKDGHLLPQEYECHLRGQLTRSFPQPELERRDIWFIDPKGQYLEKAIHDVRMAIARDAFPWYEELRDSLRVLQILLLEPERMDHLYGFGQNPSPRRSYLTGYMALTLKRHDIARTKLQEALESGCYDSVADRLAKDIEACGSTTA